MLTLSLASGSFLKKRTKKLFLNCAAGVFTSTVQIKKTWGSSGPQTVSQARSRLIKVFLLLFVHKKKCFINLRA
jgi:hypothetical protein